MKADTLRWGAAHTVFIAALIFMVHHQWEANGIAIWDNRSTQHYAVADYWPHHCVNQRATFDVPGTTTDKQNVSKTVLKGGKII